MLVDELLVRAVPLQVCARDVTCVMRARIRKRSKVKDDSKYSAPSSKSLWLVSRTLSMIRPRA